MKRQWDWTKYDFGICGREEPYRPRRRIVGWEFKIAFRWADRHDWRWIPYHAKFSNCVHWLCIYVWVSLIYEWR